MGLGSGKGQLAQSQDCPCRMNEQPLSPAAFKIPFLLLDLIVLYLFFFFLM